MERLHKVLARAGIASRRKSEELILKGKVQVNEEVITVLGAKVDPYKDAIKVNGKPININENNIYLMLHKPKGYITTASDTHFRKTVFDLVPKKYGRIFPIGRLDMQTSGLLLLTNDGDLAFKLTHPKFEIEKTYQVLIKGYIKKSSILRLEKGIELEDGVTAPARVNIIKYKDDKTLLTITIHEGKNRQVRRMFEAVGHKVIDLKRISLESLNLNGLEVGKYRSLSKKEVVKLKNI